MTYPARIVIFISGNGSNMEALIKAAATDDFPAEIVGILSDQATAGGLAKAKAHQIATFTFERRAYASKVDHEAAILTALSELKPDIICLAGYMRLLSAAMVEAYKGRILNIHPSLLPLFPGLNTHKQALDAGVKIAGCTVHLVTAEMDEGPILAQAAVPVLATDTVESLKARVLEAEHQLYPAALADFITRRPRQTSAAQALFSFGSSGFYLRQG